MSGRWRGVRRHVRESGSGITELAALELYLARNLFSWMRADYRTEGGGKVTAFQDKVLLPSQGGLAGNARSIDPNHAFAQTTGANQVAAIATSSTWGGKEVASFAGGQMYDSTLAAANWAFENSGLGGSAVFIHRLLSTAAAQILASSTNSTSSNGAIWYAVNAPTQQLFQVFRNGGGIVFNRAFGATTLLPTYLITTFRTATTPDFSAYAKAALVDSGDAGNTPDTGSPLFTMRIGAQTGSGVSGFAGELADAMFLNAEMTSLQRANVARYALLRYLMS